MSYCQIVLLSYCPSVRAIRTWKAGARSNIPLWILLLLSSKCSHSTFSGELHFYWNLMPFFAFVRSWSCRDYKLKFVQKCQNNLFTFGHNSEWKPPNILTCNIYMVNKVQYLLYESTDLHEIWNLSSWDCNWPPKKSWVCAFVHGSSSSFVAGPFLSYELKFQIS